MTVRNVAHPGIDQRRARAESVPAWAVQRPPITGLIAEGVPWCQLTLSPDRSLELRIEGEPGYEPVYALAAGGVAALFLEQAALHVGPLRVSSLSW